MKIKNKMFFLLLILVVSCRNSDEDSVKYNSDMDYSAESMTLYTKDGPLDDSTLLNDFNSRHQGFIGIIHLFDVTIKKSNSLVLLYKSYPSLNLYDSLKIIDTDSLVYWEYLYKSSEPQCLFNISKYRPRNAKMTYNDNYVTITDYHNSYYLKRDGNDFIMPILRFVYVKNETEIWGTEYNEFDPSCLLRFGDGDTIMIHKRDIRFKPE